MLDWDDLRLFLAAARSRSLTVAATHAGADAATVGRRLTRLESRLKTTLMVRSPRGVRLTPAGERLLDAALEAERLILKAASDEQDLAAGRVRISASEGFGATILAPALLSLRRRAPQLRIELATVGPLLSPDYREADLAISLSPRPSPRLIVEALTDYQLGLYAAPDYLRRRGAPEAVEDLRRHDLVGYVDDMIFAPELRYLDEIAPGLRPVLTSSSIRAQREIIASGGGIGILPCFLADGLTPLLAQTVTLTRRFWVSARADAAETARIRAVRQWLSDLVAARRTSLTPRPTRAPDASGAALAPRSDRAAGADEVAGDGVD